MKIKKYISYLIIVAFFLQLLSIDGQVLAAGNPQVQELHNEKIAKGIHFISNNYQDFQGIPGQDEREYIITADLNDPHVEIIASKPNHKVLKLDTVSNQIKQEQGKGRNVVAGINGDMFNISTGTMEYGAPLGLQVKDGKILVGFETLGSETRYPVFVLDKDNKAMITHLAMDNYLTAIGTDSTDAIIDIDTINRNNTEVMDNKMILITPQLADKPVVGFTDAQAHNAVFMVLKNIQGADDGSVRLGQEYEAGVAEVHYAGMNLKSMTVPKDGMILASHGVKADWVKEHLKAGDKVKFSFNLNDEAGRRLEIKEAVTAWLPLVKNGQALTKEEMLEICRNDWDRGVATIGASDKSRTAIGFTRDNKVIALVVDGNKPVTNSYGLDLPSMAKRMQELGVVAAVSLDGGGSTQMNTRLFGETDVNIINQPADGKERVVSNALLFVSNAPKTHDIKELKVNKDIIIFKNNSYPFQVRGQDSNGNPVDLTSADINWTIKSDEAATANYRSYIDENGVFTAGALPESLRVEANLGASKSSAKVIVVDTVSRLAFADRGVIAVQPNMPKALHINAYTQDNQPIIITNEDVEWSVTPSALATITKEGILIPREKGPGVITARIGDQEITLNFVSGLEKQLIDSYETYDSSFYSVSGYVGGKGEISTEEVKAGNHSLRIDYDYANWSKVYNGTINVRSLAEENDSYTSEIRPKKLGMWVYGDGKAPWLRGVITDGDANSHTINLASRIDWIGWQYVSGEIPADIPTPVTLNYFYMVEIDKSKNWSGTVYFDDINFLYVE